jgi:hypothetical protein
MADLRHLLPAARINQGLSERELNLLYPSGTAYEEEIRWHFYRLQSES